MYTLTRWDYHRPPVFSNIVQTQHPKYGWKQTFHKELVVDQSGKLTSIHPLHTTLQGSHRG